MQQNSHCLNAQSCGAPLILAGPDRAVENALAVFAHGQGMSLRPVERRKAVVSVGFVRHARPSAVWEERAWLALAVAGLATLVMSFWLK